MNKQQRQQVAKYDMLLKAGLASFAGSNNEHEVKRQYLNAELDKLRCLVRIERLTEIEELLMQHSQGVPHCDVVVDEILQDLTEQSAPMLWNAFGPHMCREHCFRKERYSKRYQLYFEMLEVIERAADELKFEPAEGSHAFVNEGEGIH